jgi:hypothetical protein
MGRPPISTRVSPILRISASWRSMVNQSCSRECSASAGRSHGRHHRRIPLTDSSNRLPLPQDRVAGANKSRFTFRHATGLHTTIRPRISAIHLWANANVDESFNSV